jgi:hypothetical protein
MQNRSSDKWRERADKLHIAGYTKDPYIYKACKLCWDGYYRRLKNLLARKPSLLWRAERTIDEMEAALKDCPLRPPPDHYELKRLTGDVKIGKVKFTEGSVYLRYPWFIHHLGLYGATGTGKTLWLMTLIDHILSTPDRDFRLHIFDPKNDFAHMIKRHPTLKALRKSYLRYNHFEVFDARSRDDVETGMKEDVEVLGDTCYFGATGKPIIEDAFWECFEEKGLGRWPTFQEILVKALIRAQQERLGGPKTTDVLSTIKTRFRQFVKTPAFNCERGFPLSFYLNNDIVVNMDGMNEYEQELFAIGLTNKIYMYHKKHNLRSDQLRILFIYDEGYSFFDSKKDDNPLIEHTVLRNMFRRAREFGLGFMVASPSVASISEYVRENTATIICLRTQDKNLDDVRVNLGLTEDQAWYIYKLASKFEGITRVPDFERPILFELDTDFSLKKDVTTEQIDAHMKPVIEDLYRQIQPQARAKPEPVDLTMMALQATMQMAAVRILEELRDDFFLTYTQVVTIMKDKYGYARTTVTSAIELLTAQEMILSIRCYASKTKRAMLFPLTEKGQLSLHIPETDRIAPSLFKHTFYEVTIQRWYESRGCTATREYSSEGRLDRMDLFVIDEQGRRISVEVTLSFSNISKSVEKAFNLYRVDELYIVCERRKPDLEKAIQMVSESIPAHLLERVSFFTITHFF